MSGGSYSQALVRYSLLLLTLLSFIPPLLKAGVVGGVDFLSYLSTARDWALGFEVPATAFRYFPGVYVFWGILFKLTSGRLEAIQLCYLALIVVEVLLIGWIVWKRWRSWPLLALAIVFANFYIPRLEGMYGVTEIICVFPVLLVIAFGPDPKERPELWSLLIGVACGLATFSKQQGVLLSGGVAVYALSQGRDFFKIGLISGASAIATVFAAYFVTGFGLTELKSGFGFISAYAPAASFTHNLKPFVSRTLPLLILALVFVVLRLSPRFKDRIQWGWLEFFALGAALAPWIQYSKREYLHYGLLALPWLILLSLGTIRFLFSLKPWAWYCALVIALLYIPYHRFHLPPQSLSQAISRYSDICTHLGPDADVIALPNILNEVHWLCGSRPKSLSLGYVWEHPQPAVDEALAANVFDAVAIPIMEDGKYWTKVWPEVDLEKIAARLTAQTDLRRLDLPTATLFLRRVPGN